MQTASGSGLPRDDGLQGRVALITGGASGIGRATAVAFARAGVRTVIGHYPGDPHDATSAIAAVEKAGGECIAVPLDVRESSQVDEFAQAAIDRYGRLDIVVAAAGIARRSPLEEMVDSLWNDTIDVDLTGVMRTFRSGAARMTGPGAMVAISSIAGGIYGWSSHAHYAAAKAGVLGLCRALALELSDRGVRVNAVIPGLIETPQTLDGANSLGRDNLARAGAVIPVGHVGVADDVARVIRFLSSDDSGYITGQQIVVDGGLTARRAD
ncbi:SDR family NAD(P)-dependent oxidoreductase [Ruicaihuangia caeni]|uniref:SDR family NAD(P)-dependent oxidoreductase n=1 Tax=Ruicaihuangia caeni TaxID=3042517 RepID=A0AAW6T8H9_9MICO|nr:SDR family NAD(P)-dependent oxidoreductase [Klugiella sp. YN-L-19]MDI2098653.1 SDR family NAD(P)-dependent oxidoreductase [Klugiella sp. YN-L-19]